MKGGTAQGEEKFLPWMLRSLAYISWPLAFPLNLFPSLMNFLSKSFHCSSDSTVDLKRPTPPWDWECYGPKEESVESRNVVKDAAGIMERQRKIFK